MNKEDIIRMARQAGFHLERNWDHTDWHSAGHSDLFERFATIVAAAEREACAKVCEKLRDEDGYEAWNTECAAAIRARGEQK
jgi:hypothetical protein